MTGRVGNRHAPAIAALASPVRQDILVALEDSPPRTVTELAQRLGRRPDALYHHLRALERSGMLAREARASTGGRPGSAWRLRSTVVRVPTRAVSGQGAHHAERIVGAMARASVRDYRRALRAAESGLGSRPSATRSTIWLDAEERRGLERTMSRLVRRLRARGPRDGRRPHVITSILTPAIPPPPRARTGKEPHP